jgi:hypothetical protein
MANGGWYGTREEWQRLQAPLLSIDPSLEAFAHAHGLTVSKNHKDNPDRSIRWGDNPTCLIQIYLEGDDGPTWNLWLCCTEDRGDSRYWRKDFPVRDEPVDAFRDKLPALLEDGFAMLEAWRASPEQLAFATKLTPLPPA